MAKCSVCTKPINKAHDHHDHLPSYIKKYIAGRLGTRNWHNLLKRHKREDCYKALMDVVNGSARFKAKTICEGCNTFEGSKKDIEYFKAGKKHEWFSFSVDELKKVVEQKNGKYKWKENEAINIFENEIKPVLVKARKKVDNILKCI